MTSTAGKITNLLDDEDVLDNFSEMYIAMESWLVETSVVPAIFLPGQVRSVFHMRLCISALSRVFYESRNVLVSQCKRWSSVCWVYHVSHVKRFSSFLPKFTTVIIVTVDECLANTNAFKAFIVYSQRILQDVSTSTAMQHRIPQVDYTALC